MTMSSMTLRLQLHPGPDAPASVRDSVETLVSNMLGPQRLVDLQLIVSELVANAVQHGHGLIDVRIELDGEGGVRGEVRDQGDGVEAVREADEHSLEGGIGLPVVARLARRWGAQPGSTRVWFEL
jgi:anti-sigma regulatory factor (Ser/Thr protein kinase)